MLDIIAIALGAFILITLCNLAKGVSLKEGK